MNVAFAQLNPTVGDIAFNLNLVLAAIEEAEKNRAELLLFPELFLSGYPPEDLLYRSSFLNATGSALKEACFATTGKGVTVVLGAPYREEETGKLFNAAFVFQEGEILTIYKKIKLPNYGVFDECRYFTAGEVNQNQAVFFLGEQRIGLTICEDIWGDDFSGFSSLKGCDVIVNLSSSPYHIGKQRKREEQVNRFARVMGAPLLYANLVGGQDELVFDGSSLVTDPHKERNIQVVFPSFEEGVYYWRSTSEKEVEKQEESKEESIYQALLLGLRDYVRKNHFSSVLLGLSGGIDSALTAALAVHALGAENVYGVLMPSRYSSEGSVTDAEKLARLLKIETAVIPIEPVYESFLTSLSSVWGSREPDVTEENLQARIRGNILMALSNARGSLLLTTGNKSEVSVGYCTLYGDMCGGFSVLKDLYKTEVYRLSNFINNRFGETIPQETIKKPPSAELRENQQDSDSLPDYEVLDTILKAYIEEFQDAGTIAGQVKDIPLVERVLRLVDLNEYKRRQSPPGVKLTPLAFGKDRRFPLTNGFRERLSGE